MPLPPPLPPRHINDDYLDDFDEPQPPRYGLATPAVVCGVVGLVSSVILVVLLAGFIASGKPVPKEGEEGEEVIMAIGLAAILAIGCVPTALVMSIVTAVKVRRPEPPRTGKGSAIAGGVLSTVTIVGWVVMILWLVGVGKGNRMKLLEQSHLQRIAIADMAYQTNNVGHPAPHPTLLVRDWYLSADDFKKVMAGAIEPEKGAGQVVTQEELLPAEMRQMIATAPKDVEFGAFRFGGYWFVVRSGRRGGGYPSSDFTAFSRRWSKGQSGRAVVFGDGHTEWLTEKEFAARLAEFNERRAKAGLKPVEPDDLGD